MELLPNRGRLRGSPTKGRKSEESPLPSRGPGNGHICYVTPMFSWVLERGDRIRSGNTTTGFLGAKKWVDWLHNPTFSEGPKNNGKIRNGRISLAFWGAKNGRNSYVTPAIPGVPRKGDESQVVASPFGAQNWVELLLNPGLLRGSPTKGRKSQESPLPSRGPRNGRICYVTPMFSCVLEGGDKIRSGNTTVGFSGAKK